MMKNKESSGPKRFYQKKAVKVTAVCLILLVAAGIVFRYNIFGIRNSIAAGLFASSGGPNQQLRTSPVLKGNINVTVSGSGAISSSNRMEIFPGVNSTISRTYFQQGDRVQEGDLLFELDDTDAKLNIDNIRNNIEQAKISLNSTNSNIEKLKVLAPSSGYISDLSLREGDTLGRGAAALNIIDNSRFVITVTFPAFVEIKVEQEAEVLFPGSFSTMKGTVSFVSDKTTTTKDGIILRDIQVSVPNPGYSLEGHVAQIQINSHNSVENKAFTFAGKIPVKSESGGTVEKLYVKADQYVEKGTLLMELSNDDLISSKDTAMLKIKDLENQLEAALKQLEYYKIKAPISGSIIKQNVSNGDPAERSKALAIISDPDHMEFDISIDELDIAKIQTGQKASITVDALPETEETPLTGQVTKIAVEGTSQNGVTTYPVTISINETSKLKAGMNANAEIMINGKENVLMVPLEAIQKVNGKNYVTVVEAAGTVGRATTPGQNQTRGDSADADNSQRKGPENAAGAFPARGAQSGSSGFTPEQAERFRNLRNGNGARQSGDGQTAPVTALKPVELGINNDDYAEVISGLELGELVVLPNLAGNSGQNNAQIRGMGGMNFGPVGAMPAGEVRIRR